MGAWSGDWKGETLVCLAGLHYPVFFNTTIEWIRAAVALAQQRKRFLSTPDSEYDLLEPVLEGRSRRHQYLQNSGIVGSGLCPPCTTRTLRYSHLSVFIRALMQHCPVPEAFNKVCLYFYLEPSSKHMFWPLLQLQIGVDTSFGVRTQFLV